MPEHAVFRLVFPLDLHVVVNQHHPFFGVGVDDAGRALVLVAVEIHRHVVPPAAGDVAQQHPGQAEVHHPEEAGRGGEVFDVEVLMGGQVEKALEVEEVDIDAAAAEVDVVEDIGGRRDLEIRP